MDNEIREVFINTYAERTEYLKIAYCRGFRSFSILRSYYNWDLMEELPRTGFKSFSDKFWITVL